MARLYLLHPDDNLTVAVLANLAGGGPGMIAKVVAGMINPALMPPKLTAIPDDQPALAASLKKLLAQLAAGEDVRSQMSTELAADLTPEALKVLRVEMKDVLPPDSLELVIRKTFASGVASCYRIRKGDHALLVTYQLDKAGKISMFRDSPDQEYR